MMVTKNFVIPVLAASAVIAMLATAACSSSGSFHADSPVDAAMVPDANYKSHDANIDNRGPGY